MIVYPAIDLRDGACVRLMHGRFDQVTRYDDDPAARLAGFVEAGAEWVHVVDLDGAQAGEPRQHDLIGKLARDAGLRVQAGGGIRTWHDADALLGAGVDRVVVGSVATRDPAEVRNWLEFDPERFTLAFDVRMEGDVPVPALKGWTERAGRDLWETLDAYPPGTARDVLVTDIGRDGALTGPNLDLLAEIVRRRPDLRVQASGGVAETSDLTAARDAGCAGAIVGRAIYEGRFTVEQALEAVR